MFKVELKPYDCLDRSFFVAPTKVGLFQLFFSGLSEVDVTAAKLLLIFSYVFIHILFVCASNVVLVRNESTTYLFRLVSIVFPEAELLINLKTFSSILLADAFRLLVLNCM